MKAVSNLTTNILCQIIDKVNEESYSKYDKIDLDTLHGVIR